MKPKTFMADLWSTGFALVLASILTLATAFGQNLVIGTGSTFTGAGTYLVKGNITNAGVAGATTIGGTVTMNGAAGQTIGTALNGQIDFGTLNINTSAGTKTTTAAVATAVSANLAIAAASVYDIGTNTLQIDAASSIGAGGSLNTAAGSTVTFDGGGAQTVLGGFTYNGGLTLSGAGAKTMSSAGLTTVAQAFSHTGAALTISSGGLTLNTTGAFAAVNNNGGTLTGGSGAATFSGLLTQNGGNLTAGSGGLALNAGLTNTSGNITLSGHSMSISGGQFTYAAGTLSFDAASTVTYGASATNIVPTTYGNLILNADTKTFPAGTTNVATLLTANSSMIIANTGTLAMSTATANANIGGDFTDNGTFTAASGAGVVTFNGAAQALAGTATPTFRNLTLAGTGTKTASTGINISNGGQLAVNQTLAMGANTLTMQTGALTPSFAGQTEITGNMSWQASAAATYTFNNSATSVTFTGGPDVGRTFTLNSAPGTYPTGNSVGQTVNRSYTASYAGWSTGNVNLTLAYLQGEASTLGVTEAKLKDFQNGAINSGSKMPGLPSGRVTSGAGTFGSVTYSALTNAQLLPASNNALALDDRFNQFTSIAIANWNAPTTWDANAIPSASDDVVIAGAFGVTIPTGYPATANSVQINTGVSGGLTVAGTGTLTTTALGGGITNNNANGAGLNVGGSASVTVNGSLTNNGAITNAGSITVQ
jgi:hypothetical protein